MKRCSLCVRAITNFLMSLKSRSHQPTDESALGPENDEINMLSRLYESDVAVFW